MASRNVFGRTLVISGTLITQPNEGRVTNSLWRLVGETRYALSEKTCVPLCSGLKLMRSSALELKR